MLPANMVLPESQQGSKTSPYCKDVWGKDGTICKPDVMLSFARDTNKISQSLAARAAVWPGRYSTLATAYSVTSAAAIQNHGALMAGAASLSTSSGQPLRRLLLAATSGLSGASTTGVVSSVSTRGIQAQISPQLNVELVKPLVAFDISSFIINLNTCWSYLNRARNTSMCYACSQENSKYFANGKAIIGQQDCSNMLTSCLPFFSDVTVYVKNANSVFASTESPNNWNAGHLAILKKLYTGMVNANLTAQISLYKTTTTAKVRTNTGDSICLKLFRLYQSPIFDTIGEMVDAVTTELTKETARSLQGTSSGSSSPNSAGVSQTTSGSSDGSELFVGDVAIFKTADDGSSILQFSDFSSSPATDGYKPMNLSLAFP
jgi:hypothetical protein